MAAVVVVASCSGVSVAAGYLSVEDFVAEAADMLLVSFVVVVFVVVVAEHEGVVVYAVVVVVCV